MHILVGIISPLVAQFTTDDIGLLETEEVVADAPPLTRMVHLHATSIGQIPIHQPHSEIFGKRQQKRGR